MSRQIFAKIGWPAVVMAVLMMAGVAGAQPRLPMPLPPRLPMPPAPRPPMFPAPRPPMFPAARPAAPPLMGRPAWTPPPGGHFGGGSARLPHIPSGPTLLARPNSGSSPSLAGLRPGGWNPPVVNHGREQPTANLSTARSATINGGAVVANERRAYYWRGFYGSHHNRMPYRWRGYSSYYPYYRNTTPILLTSPLTTAITPTAPTRPTTRTPRRDR
jgi:hypothetical protein